MIKTFGSTMTQQVHHVQEGRLASSTEPPSRQDKLAKAIAETEGRTGISSEHIKLMSDVALTEDTVIIVRPYNPHNAPLLAAGHPTKGIDIKGKSSDWGPHFGFIPKDQQFSKLEGGSKTDIDLASAQLDTCVESKAADVIDLRISKERIVYLIGQGLITQNGAGPKFTLECNRENSKTDYSFQAESIHGIADMFTISHNGTPLQVLTPHIAETSPTHIVTTGNSAIPRKAYTADYDLFAILPSIINLGAEHLHRRGSNGSITSIERKLSGRVSFTPHKSDTSLVTERRSSVASLSSSEKSDDARDITTDHELKIKDLLNKKLRPGCEPEFNIIQHGSDQGNPKPDDEANFPVTVICPKSIGEFSLVCILNPEELNSFAVSARDTGYLFSLNPNWNTEGLAKTSLVARRRDAYEKMSTERSAKDGAPFFRSDMGNSGVVFNTNIFNDPTSVPARNDAFEVRTRRESNVAPIESGWPNSQSSSPKRNSGPTRRGSVAPEQTLLAVSEALGESEQ